MIQKLTSITFLLFFLISCSSTHSLKSEKLIIGEKLKANRVSNLYFSGQPKKKDLVKLKEQGFSTVINLRSPKEHDEAGERSLLQKDGINYYNLPFPNKLQIDDAYTDKVYATIKKHRDSGNILVHCSSGNRVAIWIGAHFNRHHDSSKEESISTAKKLGLTKKKAEKALQKYLESK